MRTILLVITVFITASISYADYIDDLLMFKKVQCSAFGISETAPTSIDGFQQISLDFSELNLSYIHDKKLCEIEPIENIKYEYARHPTNDVYNWFYIKRTHNKYQLIVKKTVDKGFFKEDWQFKQNKCFVADIPVSILEAEAKSKSEQQQKDSNKKKWAEGE